MNWKTVESDEVETILANNPYRALTRLNVNDAIRRTNTMHRWSRDVAAEALQAWSVTAVERDLGVNVDPADLGKRTCPRWRNEAQRVGELGGLCPAAAPSNCTSAADAP